MNDIRDRIQHASELKKATEEQLHELRSLLVTDAWEDNLTNVTDEDRRAAADLHSDVEKLIGAMRLRKLQELVQDFMTHEQDLIKAQADVKETTAKFTVAAQRIKAIGDFVKVVGRILKVGVSLAT